MSSGAWPRRKDTAGLQAAARVLPSLIVACHCLSSFRLSFAPPFHIVPGHTKYASVREQGLACYFIFWMMTFCMRISRNAESAGRRPSVLCFARATARERGSVRERPAGRRGPRLRPSRGEARWRPRPARGDGGGGGAGGTAGNVPRRPRRDRSARGVERGRFGLGGKGEEYHDRKVFGAWKYLSFHETFVLFLIYFQLIIFEFFSSPWNSAKGLGGNYPGMRSGRAGAFAPGISLGR